MISLTTLIIAAVIVIALLLFSVFVPNPITWMMTIALGAVFWFILLHNYQGQQQAEMQGVVVQAAVSDVREWSRKQGDQYQDRYEIVALAPHPETGNMFTFVSPPLNENPKPYLGDTVEVRVDWSNPKAYVMDLSFLPNPPQ